MAAPAITPLRLFQMGKEATKGTPVAAAWQMVGDSIWTPTIARYMSDYPRGVRVPVTGGGTPISAGCTIQQTTDLTYEEIIYALNLGMATGVITGGSADKTHTFTPIITGDPTILTATSEYAFSDGSTTAFPFPGATGYPVTMQSAYTFSGGFDITFAFNAIAQATYRYIARYPTLAVTPTAALTVLTGRERIPSNLFKVYLDTTFAGIGSTQLTGVVRSGKYTFVPGIEPDYTLDGRANLDFTQIRWGMDAYATLSLVMELDATSALEIKAWNAQNAGGGALTPNTASGGNVALRFIRLEATSPNTLGASNRRIRLDGAYVYTKEPVFSQQNKAELVTLELKTEYDPVSAKSFQAAIVNSIGTFS